MKPTFIFFFFHLFILPVVAQTIEPEATIELLDGTVINGKIRYSNWTTIPPFIEFIQKGEIKRVYPSTIKNFKVNNEQYISHTISFHTGSLDMQLLPETYSNDTLVQTVFLKLLVKGSYSLYFYANENRRYYFLQKPEGLPEELLYRIKMKDRLLDEDKTYQSQLAGIAESAKLDAASVQKAYELNYNTSELSSYVNRINGGHAVVTKEKSDQLHVNLEAGAGILMPLYYGKGDPVVVPINTINANTSVGPVLHAGILFSKDPAFTFTRWMLQFRYSNFNVSGRSQTITSASNSYYEEYDFSMAHFNAGLGMLQIFSKENASLKFYGSLTGNVGFLLSKPGVTKLIRVSDGSLLTTYYDYPKLNKRSVSGIIALGCIKNRFRAELFYQSPFRIASQDKSNFSASTVGVSLRIAIKNF
jgi:hypothetical protein